MHLGRSAFWRWTAILVVLALAACQSSRGPVATAPPSGYELVIAHVNDTHSHVEAVKGQLDLLGNSTYLALGGMPRLTSFLKQVRAEHPQALFLHAGDAVQGTIYFLKYHGQIEMELLNALGCDAMVLGNHEFDRGPKGTGKIVGWANFPIVVANLDASREPALRDKVRPYIVKEVKGQKIGIIGIITPETAVIANSGPNLKFLPVAPTVKKYIALLQGQGINKIILLTHQGFENDLALAKEVAGIDVIVGGHTHTLLGDAKALGALGLTPESSYPTLVKGPTGLPVYVVQAWEWAKVAGQMRLTFDDLGVVRSFQGNAQLLAGEPFRQKQKGKQGKPVVSPAVRAAILAEAAKNPSIEVLANDPATQKIITPYRQGLQKLLTTVVARVASDLLHVRVPGAGQQGGGLPKGSMVAPIIARSMLWKARTTGMKVDLAWQNAGGVRNNIMAGDLTIAGAFSLLPFGNTLIVIELSGADLKRALEWGVTTSGGAFPYLAGARYWAEMTRPEGQRITRVELAGPNGKWIPLNDKASYRLVTSSFVANGGDGCEILAKTSGYRYDTGFVDAEAFMAYAKKLGVLRPPQDTGVYYTPAK